LSPDLTGDPRFRVFSTPPSATSHAVLLIDADLAQALQVMRVVMAMGYTVDVEETGRAALTRLDARETGYQLVCVDMAITDVPVHKLLQAIRDKSARTRIILFADAAQIPDAVDAVKGDADYFLLKPIEDDDFQTVMQRLDLDRRNGVDVSVVLPAMNEEQTIGRCIEKITTCFAEQQIRGEIIVADNSLDKTPYIARSLGATVVTPDQRGYGYAYRYAFDRAQGDYIVMGDADDTYDFRELPNLLAPVIQDEADLVLGNRFSGNMEAGAMPRLHRLVGNPLLTWFLNRFFHVGVADAHSGFRVFTRHALDTLELRSNGMEFASEMIIDAARKGLRVKEVPIAYYRRMTPDSKLSSWTDGWRHLKFMLLQAPNYLFVYPSLVLLGVGAFMMLAALFQVFIGWHPGTHSLIAGSLLVIAGYQAFFFGLFANLFQARRMPRFLSLERGATVGSIIFVIGLGYVLYLVYRWVSTGFAVLPLVEYDILGFTFIVLGLQTFLGSFMLSLLAERR
jgi:glycosyltransferase involved in cell wall biosynthesis